MKKVILAFILLTFIPFAVEPQSLSGTVGWASVNANGQDGTTGGAGGTIVTVSDMTQLINYCGLTDSYIIQITDLILITPKGRFIDVKSDKTIIGIGQNAGVTQGGFRVVDNQRNIIFKNLTISDTYVPGDWEGKTQDWDGIQLKGTCHHIWIDHCTFLRQGDGALDITNGANYITVSYSKFGENNKACLFGSSDTDPHTDKYKVTMHHNWFNETTQRHPRVRFGMVHLFNNYYYKMGGYGTAMGYATSNGYGIGVGVSARIYSERNYFENVVYPSQFYDNTALPGYISDIGSHFVQSGNMITNPAGVGWNPGDYYAYSLDNATQVKTIVLISAGAGQGLSNIFEGPEIHSQLELYSYPNPFSDFARLAFVLPNNGRVSLKLFDITGREIREVYNKQCMAGRNEIILTRDGINSGIYIIGLEFKGSNLIRKIVLN